MVKSFLLGICYSLGFLLLPVDTLLLTIVLLDLLSSVSISILAVLIETILVIHKSLTLLVRFLLLLLFLGIAFLFFITTSLLSLRGLLFACELSGRLFWLRCRVFLNWDLRHWVRDDMLNWLWSNGFGLRYNRLRLAHIRLMRGLLLLRTISLFTLIPASFLTI